MADNLTFEVRFNVTEARQQLQQVTRAADATASRAASSLQGIMGRGLGMLGIPSFSNIASRAIEQSFGVSKLVSREVDIMGAAGHRLLPGLADQALIAESGRSAAERVADIAGEVRMVGGTLPVQAARQMFEFEHNLDLRRARGRQATFDDLTLYQNQPFSPVPGQPGTYHNRHSWADMQNDRLRGASQR